MGTDFDALEVNGKTHFVLENIGAIYSFLKIVVSDVVQTENRFGLFRGCYLFSMRYQFLKKCANIAESRQKCSCL